MAAVQITRLSLSPRTWVVVLLALVALASVLSIAVTQTPYEVVENMAEQDRSPYVTMPHNQASFPAVPAPAPPAGAAGPPSVAELQPVQYDVPAPVQAAPPPSPPSPPPAVDADNLRISSFDRIYNGHEWGSGESLSGPGSYLSYTVRVRRLINAALKLWKIERFLDAPCGDCNWQPEFDNFSSLSYTGVDIVRDVIINNTRKYFNRQNMRFAHFDLVKDHEKLLNDIKGQYDAIMTRDAVQHLPVNDGMTIYKMWEGSGAKILISNFFVSRDHPNQPPPPNVEISPGAFYPNNPMLAPFLFGPPILFCLDEDNDWFSRGEDHKFMGVWEIKNGLLGKGDGTFDVNMVNITAFVNDDVYIGSTQKWATDGLKKLGIAMEAPRKL